MFYQWMRKYSFKVTICIRKTDWLRRGCGEVIEIICYERLNSVGHEVEYSIYCLFLERCFIRNYPDMVIRTSFLPIAGGRNTASYFLKSMKIIAIIFIILFVLFCLLVIVAGCVGASRLSRHEEQEYLKKLNDNQK